VNGALFNGDCDSACWQVDHGKTTLVDKLFEQSGTNQVVSERAMDFNPLEKERGITIFAKNAAVTWRDYKINLIGEGTARPSVSDLLLSPSSLSLSLSLTLSLSHSHSLSQRHPGPRRFRR
jgi:hypothetical protein